MNLLKVLPLNETKLKVLLEIYAEGEDYLRNIEKKTKINPSLLFRILKSFKEAKLVFKKEKGKENFYSLTKEGEKLLVKILEKYHLDKTAEKTKEVKLLLKLLLNNKELMVSCQEIYLFGSFVLGNLTKKSDIDILFVSEERKKIIKWCGEASLIVGREINPLIYTSEKFKLELKKKEPMLTSVVKNIKNRIILLN